MFGLHVYRRLGSWDTVPVVCMIRIERVHILHTSMISNVFVI